MSVFEVKFLDRVLLPVPLHSRLLVSDPKCMILWGARLHSCCLSSTFFGVDLLLVGENALVQVHNFVVEVDHGVEVVDVVVVGEGAIFLIPT